MSSTMEVARDFLAQERIAVAGVSRSGASAANAIFAKLRETGHEVVAVNPNATHIDGETCYPDLQSIPGGVDAVVAVTTPEQTERVVDQCIQAGVSRVWMHRSPMGNSVSPAAVGKCHEHHIGVIAGGCPLMFDEPVDFGHKCIRWWCGVTGGLPKEADLPGEA